MPRLCSLAFLLLLSVGCRPDAIDLAYRFPDQDVIVYRVEASAQANWDIQGEGEGSYRAVFEVTESVEAVTPEAATVRVTIEPIEIEEDGLLSPGSEGREFVLRVGPNGEKLDVLEVNGVEAASIADDEIALIGTYRPPLPIQPVGLHDGWQADQTLELGPVFQQLASQGIVESFDRDEEGKVATLSYAGSGPLEQTVVLPQGRASLTGRSDLDISAVLDIEGGFLREATSTTVGTFDARVIPLTEQVPIVGTLDLELDLHIEKLDRAPTATLETERSEGRI